MSYLSKEKLVFQAHCDFHEGTLSRTDLEALLFDLLSREQPEGRMTTFMRMFSNALLINELAIDNINEKFRSLDSAERRRQLLYMRGFSQTHIEDCGIRSIFHVHKTPSRLANIKDTKQVALAAAVLDVPFTVLMVNSCVPAPAEEAPWYIWLDSLTENTKDNYRPVFFSADYFQHGKTEMDLGRRKELIGVTSLWLRNGFTQITFTVDQQAIDDCWEQRLLEFGKLRGLDGPSVFIMQRIMLHSGNHKLYRMIWPVRDKTSAHVKGGVDLEPHSRLLLYSRLYTPYTIEASFFRSPKEHPKTIKYPQLRKPEVSDLLQGIGMNPPSKGILDFLAN